MSGPGAAFRHLTLVPVPGGAGEGPAAVGRAAGWFPAVGLVLGLGLAGLDWMLGWLFPPLLASLLTLAAWKLASGGLHLDGLADCLDGLAGADADSRLRIMRDSRVGTFGATGVMLVLALQGAALAGLPLAARARALAVVPALARATPAVLARRYPPARADGQGALFRAGLRPGTAARGLGLGAAAALVALGPVGLLATGGGLLAALGVGAFMRRRLAGITGDVLGAAVEVAELAALLAVAAWTHARP